MISASHVSTVPNPNARVPRTTPLYSSNLVIRCADIETSAKAAQRFLFHMPRRVTMGLEVSRGARSHDLPFRPVFRRSTLATDLDHGGQEVNTMNLTTRQVKTSAIS